jgi:hypothetical protein
VGSGREAVEQKNELSGIERAFFGPVSTGDVNEWLG